MAVSVIVPVYNVEKYLPKCIDSIMKQSYSKLDIILVDDGSTDASGAICDSYATKDSRITVLHKRNGGLSDARNHGLDKATGEYVLFVDSDDYIHPQMVAILMEALEKNAADIAVCGFREVREEETITPPDIGESEKIASAFSGNEKYEQLYFNNLQTVVAWNKLYRRHIFEKLRYPVGKLQEDEYIIHLLLYEAQKLVYIKADLYYYVQRQNSIMGKVSLNNVWDGYLALQERADFFRTKEISSAYTQNKINQMYYAIGHYIYVKQTYDDKELLCKLKQSVLDNIKDSDVRNRIGKEQLAKFRLFLKNPKWYNWYYQSEGKNTAFHKVLRKGIGWLEKL